MRFRFLLAALAVACTAKQDADPAPPASQPKPGSGGSQAQPGGAGSGGYAAGAVSPIGTGGVTAMSSGGSGSLVGGQGAGSTPQLPSAGSGGQSGAGPLGKTEIIAEPTDDASSVFAQDAIQVYDITVSPSDLARIDQNPAGEEYIAGSLAVDGNPIGEIGFRYKGSVGAFLSPCTATTNVGSPTGAKTGKCSMKVAFDHFDPEMRYRGLKKLNFHAMNQDPSMLRERLAYSLFREMGIAAPRAMHARVNINGKFEGLFIAVEQIDGRFTRSRFSEGGKGNLYKEVWPMHDSAEVYRAALETNEDEDPVLDRIVNFAAAAKQGSAAVEGHVDRAYVARYLAADRVMANDDGSAHWWCLAIGQGNNPGGVGNHNYYWYEEEVAGRFWLIPWDMDSSLGATNFVRIQPEWRTKAPCTCAGNPPQRPTSCDPLFAAWAEWNTDYESAVDDFLGGPFASSRIEDKLTRWSTQIGPVITEAAGLNGAPTVPAWELAGTFLRLAIESLRQNRGSL